MGDVVAVVGSVSLSQQVEIRMMAGVRAELEWFFVDT